MLGGTIQTGKVVGDLRDLARWPQRPSIRRAYSAKEKLRTPLPKSGDPFAFPQHIVSSLDKTCGELKREGHLSGSDLERFATRGAYYLGEINAIHPFRDGNRRAQREFIRELGLNNGLMIDWRQVSREEMVEASRRSLRTDNAGLEQILRKGLDHQPNRQRDLERGQGGIEKAK
jgi:cell filamentation protein